MIVVTGATGHVGGAALRRLVARGLPVAALVRDAARAALAVPAGTPLRIADYDDRAALERAFHGVERLLFVASDGDGRAVMRHHANVIDAAAATGVAHVVFTSIVDTAAASPFYYAPVYRDAERRLAESGVGWSLLRCGLYSDFVLAHWLRQVPSTGEMKLPAGQGCIAPVSRDDVAAAAAALVAGPVRGRAYELSGPEALSLDEVATLATAALGRAIRYVPSSSADYLHRLRAGLPDPWPHAFSTLCASIAEGRYGGISHDFEELTGRLPERFKEFLARAAEPS